MAGFTQSNRTRPVPNKAGGPSFAYGPKFDLATRIGGTFREPKYYGYDEQALIDSIHAVLKIDPEFVLKAAAYARNELHMRSVPLLLLVEYANVAPGMVKNARRYVPAICRRADELAQAIACQFERNKRHPRKVKLPMMLHHGLRPAFEKHDRYGLAKYRGDDESVTLRDAMFLTHPKPREGLEATYRELADDELRIDAGATWERIISEQGSTPEAWAEAAKVMPYMALLRNLRNLVEKGVDLSEVKRRIADPEAVRRSRQMPFRFLSAYRELEQVAGTPSSLLGAVSDALDISVGNMPELTGRTAVWADVSGSMHTPVSQRSVVTQKDIAVLFAAAVARASDDARVGVFAEQAKFVQLNPRDSVMTNAKVLAGTLVGGATYAHKVFDTMSREAFDRIVLLSDMQCYTDSGYRYSFGERPRDFRARFFDYRAKVSPNAQLVSFDLDGYGDSLFPEGSDFVMTFAGWSDRALRLIAEPPTSIVQAIEGYRV